MEKIKLFIADANPEHIERVRHALAQSETLRIAGTSCDGRSALRQIVRLNPDALLTDIQLPGLDGISLLKELRYMKRPPVCIVCTRF